MSFLDTLKENKQKVMVRVVTALGGLVTLALLLPIIFAALQAALGLAAVGVVAIIGIGIFQALPLLGQKWENALLGARKAEARANPIEQAQNILLKRKEQIRSGEQALNNLSGVIKSMERMLDEQARKDPDHDLTTPRKSLEAMRHYYAAKIEKLKSAIAGAKEYEKEIERKKFELAFAQTGRIAAAGIEGAEGDPMQQLLSDEAFKSVSDQFDEVFGALEVSSLLDQAEQMQSTQVKFEAIMQPRERSIG
jgi:hypothetical protein